MILEKLAEFVQEPRSAAGAKMVGSAMALFRQYLEGPGENALSPQTLVGFNDWLAAEHPNWGSQTRRMTISYAKSFIGWLKRQGMDVPDQDREGLPKRERRKKVVQQPQQVAPQPTADEPLDRGDFAADQSPQFDLPIEQVPTPAAAQPAIHVHMPGAATRGRRTAVPETATSVATSPTLKRAFGNAESIKVYKVDDLGRQALVGGYPVSVLASCKGDVEMFVLRYLAPRLGHGDYLVEGFNARGDLVGSKSIQLQDMSGITGGFGHAADPILCRPSGSPVDRLVDRINQLENQIRTQYNQPPKSMIEQAEDMARLKTLFGGDQSAMLMYMLSARPEAKTDPVVLAELAALKQQVEQQKHPLAGVGTPLPPALPLPPPAHDPVDYKGLSELISTLKPPPPAAPPPGPDPMAMFTAMGQMFQTMMQPLIASMQRSGPSPVEEVLRAQVADLKDEIQEMNQQPPRGLAEIVGELQLIQQIPQILGQTKNDAESGFMGIINKFLDTFPKNAAALKDMAVEVRRNEDERRAREAAAARPVQQQAEQPAPPPLPRAFAESIHRLDSAQDDPMSRMQIVMEALWELGKDERFKQMVQDLLDMVHERNKIGAMTEIKGFLTNCAETGMISADAAQRTSQDFDRNFETVTKYLDKLTKREPKVVEPKAPANGKPAAAGKPEAPAAAEQEPAGDGDDDEEDEEEAPAAPVAATA